MLSLSTLLVLGLGVVPYVVAPTRAQVVEPPTHGRLDWFDGSFEELLAEAGRSERTVFLDFWADWCSWCKRLDRDVFSKDAVVGEMASFLCYAVDKESEAGGRLAQRYHVGTLPTLLFLDAEGEVLDALVGYKTPAEFLARVGKVKRGEDTLPALRKAVREDPDDLFRRFELAIKLHEARAPDTARELAHVRQQIQRGEGYDPDSIDDQWRLVQAYQRLGDRTGVARHMSRIEALDPEGRSYPLRLRRLRAIQRQIRGRYAAEGVMDLTPLDRFLAEEAHETLKFEGWRLAIDLHAYVAEEARMRGQSRVQAASEAAVRRAQAQAWSVCPADQRASFGHDLAWSWYVKSDDLTEEELVFAVRVAEEAVAAAPGSANHLDTLACCLYEAGATERAIELLERAIELAPDELRYQRRLREFRGDDDATGDDG